MISSLCRTRIGQAFEKAPTQLKSKLLWFVDREFTTATDCLINTLRRIEFGPAFEKNQVGENGVDFEISVPWRKRI
ncbi:unnamed protein product [Linum trigynum]|uniref:Uncharacterized protein n=1 Tax=Linum trigynum TaxID=586398 RepID=A0AAV2GPL9_9ROSI